MKKIVYFGIWLILVNQAYSQQLDCGTEATSSQLEFMDSIHSNLAQLRNANLRVRVPLKFHIIKRSDGSGGLSANRISSLISEVNNSFSGSGITFIESGEPEFINSDQFYNLDASNENALANGRDVRGVINMYVSGTLTSGGSNLCGYTRFPPSADRVFLALGCTSNSYQTTAHELGHYLTLFHTHGKTNTGTTDELVKRVNCENLGDNLCDTPADPNLSGNVGGGCVYTGSATDANGDIFKPDPSNIMSYAPSGCQNKFLGGQLDRMAEGLINGRSYLDITYDNFTARFIADTRVGCAPLTIRYTENTSGSSSRVWEFEGANIDRSVLANPEVTYAEPGRYFVKLTVRNSGGAESEIIRNNFITVNDVYEFVIQDTTIENFESDQLPNNWNIVNYDQLQTFTVSDVSFNGNSKSILINNFDYYSPTIPEIDDLELSSFDIEEVKSFKLVFHYAYTYKPGDFSNNISPGQDVVEVGYKINCNDRFYSIYQNKGDEFKTAPESNSFFEPSSSDEWRKLEFNFQKQDLVNFENLLTVRPTIRNKSYNGNNFYLDNVELTPDFSLDSIQSFRVSNQSQLKMDLRWFNPAINETAIQIERSVDGVNFTVIGEVPKNQTEFSDNELPLDAPFIYYRAANINSKSKSSYTPIIEVSRIISSNKSAENELNSISLYPNPTADGIVNISGNCDEIGAISNIQIFSVTGQLQAALGQSDIQNINGDIRFSIRDLRSGIYFVEIKDINVCKKVFRIIKK